MILCQKWFVWRLNFFCCCRGNDDGSFEINRRYVGEDLEIELTSGTVCDIATFTVWCRTGGVFFSRLDISPDTFVSQHLMLWEPFLFTACAFPPSLGDRWRRFMQICGEFTVLGTQGGVPGNHYRGHTREGAQNYKGGILYGVLLDPYRANSLNDACSVEKEAFLANL